MKRIFLIFLLIVTVFYPIKDIWASSTDGTISLTNYKSSFLDEGSEINWLTTTGAPVHITNNLVTGDIWGENVGWIRLNPSGGYGGVTNTAGGVLSGYAWGENTGWINFAPSNGGVTIDSSGKFSGHAWSENYGWMVFSCPSSTTCVETDWRPNGGSGGGGTIDQCPLIPGTQSDVSQCTPPNDTDYCPLIPGTQSDPAQCPLVTPTDYCPLIPGTQSDPSLCQQPPVETCATNPSLCPPPSFCTLNPADPSCLPPPDFCTLNPTSPLCNPPPSFCVLNPNDPLCVPPPFCTLNPADPSCLPPPPPDYICDIDPNILTQALCIIEDSIDDTITITLTTWEEIKNSRGNFLSRSIAIVGLVAGMVFMLLPMLFQNPLSFSEILLIPYRLWSLLMVVFGLKKRSRPWGTVYDAITKQPLDPVLVSLVDSSGVVIATSITDIDGRYGFLVAPGKYTIIPKKTNYKFPSIKLISKTRDELYLDLYFGSEVEIKKEGEVITKNIPMDPENFDWNEFAKADKKLMRLYSKRDVVVTRIADLVFSFGFLVAVIAFIVAPIKYNIVVFALYVVILVLKEMGLKRKKTGTVEDVLGNPYSFAIIRVYTSETKTEIARKVTSKIGHYYCLVQNGSYYVTVEKKNIDESYTLVFTSPTLEVTKGIIHENFKIDEDHTERLKAKANSTFKKSK